MHENRGVSASEAVPGSDAAAATRITPAGDVNPAGAAAPANGVGLDTDHPRAARDPSVQPVIKVTNLAKTYVMGTNVVPALRGVSLAVWPGEFVEIMGPSGSGKSTFMNVIGCLDRPTEGSYQLDGREVTDMTPNALADFRNRKLGFIFQGFNLLQRMDALGNVMLPMLYANVPANVRRERGLAAIDAVGLAGRADHRPNELSGGQQQRVAIARALVNTPAMILADEPTGNLDSRTSVEIMAILQNLNRDGATIVLVTHEPDIAEHCSRVVTFRDGRLVSDEDVAQPIDARGRLEEMIASGVAES